MSDYSNICEITSYYIISKAKSNSTYRNGIPLPFVRWYYFFNRRISAVLYKKVRLVMSIRVTNHKFRYFRFCCFLLTKSSNYVIDFLPCRE